MVNVLSHYFFNFVKKTLIQQLNVQVFALNGKSKRSVLPIPVINYCDLMRGQANTISVLKYVLADLNKHGKIFGVCPIAPNSFYLRDFYLDDASSPLLKMLRPNRKYMLNFTFTEEKSTKSVLIVSLEIYFSRN
jgi:Protein of unknown function (DUF1091)